MEAASAVPAGAASAAAPAEEGSPGAAASGEAPGAADLAADNAPEGRFLITVRTRNGPYLESGAVRFFMFCKYKTDILKYKIRFGVEIPDIPGDETSYR